MAQTREDVLDARLCAFTALLFLVTVSTALADPPPEPIVRLITEAARTGNPANLDQAAAFAKNAYPASAAEIDALVANLRAQAETARIARLQQLGFFQGWSGEGEVGASETTGTARNTTVAVGLKLNRLGLDWDHHFTALVDYQRSNGLTTANRELASYEADYRFAPRLFANGLVQWEQDRFAGFNRRFTETVGIGYSIITTPAMTWQASGGPALRQTSFITGLDENDLSARGATQLIWHVAAATTFTEDAGLYIGGRDNTYFSTTALTTNIFGDLSARLSFNVNVESKPPPGIDNTSTISRITLVYSF
jgi:putative salt-induced outer membrane protein